MAWMFIPAYCFAIPRQVVFRFALGRKLRLVQWFAILLLLFGMCVAKMKMGVGGDDPDAGRSGKVQEELWNGFLCMLVVAVTSAVAGVYNEYLIKTDKTSLFWKNCQLYFFSTLSCVLAGAWTATQGGDGDGGGDDGGFLRGFGVLAWSVVLLNGILGQIISAIFLYASVIVKVYAASGAILVTAFISSVMFGTPLTIPLFIGIGIALLSMFLYFLPPGTLDKEDVDVCTAIAAKATAAGLVPWASGAAAGTRCRRTAASPPRATTQRRRAARRTASSAATTASPSSARWARRIFRRVRTGNDLRRVILFGVVETSEGSGWVRRVEPHVPP